MEEKRQSGLESISGTGVTEKVGMMVPRKRVEIRLDASELIVGLATLSTEIPQLPPKIIERMLGICDAPREAVIFDVDASAAASTGVVAVRLQPSDAFRRLVAAARAGNVDGLAVENTRHG